MTYIALYVSKNLVQDVLSLNNINLTKRDKKMFAKVDTAHLNAINEIFKGLKMVPEVTHNAKVNFVLERCYTYVGEALNALQHPLLDDQAKIEQATQMCLAQFKLLQELIT